MDDILDISNHQRYKHKGTIFGGEITVMGMEGREAGTGGGQLRLLGRARYGESFNGAPSWSGR